MKTELQPAPVASTVDSSPFDALLDREHVSTLPMTETPVPAQSKPEPKQTVLVWVEREIEMNINRCAVCGKVRCPCPNRELISIRKTIRYQVEQK